MTADSIFQQIYIATNNNTALERVFKIYEAAVIERWVLECCWSLDLAPIEGHPIGEGPLPPVQL